MLGLGDVLRNEVPKTIGVSVFCPGLVTTELHLSKRYGPLPQDEEDALAFGHAIMAQGMDPAEIGRAAVDGVERGDFIIATHANSFLAATARYDEIAAAFAAQAPWTPGAERYDVNNVIASVAQSGLVSSAWSTDR